jgi:hypothetical protein
MSVPLHYLTAGLERYLIERIGQLAQPAAGVWNNASFSQLSPGNKPAVFGCSTEVFPKTENSTCGNNETV